MTDEIDASNDISAAIYAAVKESGQEEELATKILAWFSSLSSGNASLSDRSSVHRHMELLLDHVQLGDLEEEAGGSNGD